ncbi:nucleotidyltransferase domain-containing protein [Caloramator sp. CAR-1]|uniref:nucleotidyltransferase domain-containing protein n=1 Tax=Caloramator sp. CAR-1 TaxID=3062777 RepID=UPI0026E331A3|nr:nucleotidyltransferase domain-containing protein [Caloramator sp. CAR-1]MDO6353825.1 nucleotidyltransferase domain-containing protein [Caloramator sp. CAR-1]
MDNEIINLIKEKLITNINPKAIILFGSVARNEGNENSDIDLLVVWDDIETNVAKRRIKLRKIIGFIDKPLDILTCSSKELEEALKENNSFTSRIIKEGKIIYGGLN